MGLLKNAAVCRSALNFPPVSFCSNTRLGLHDRCSSFFFSSFSPFSCLFLSYVGCQHLQLLLLLRGHSNLSGTRTLGKVLGNICALQTHKERQRMGNVIAPFVLLGFPQRRLSHVLKPGSRACEAAAPY